MKQGRPLQKNLAVLGLEIACHGLDKPGPEPGTVDQDRLHFFVGPHGVFKHIPSMDLALKAALTRLKFRNDLRQKTSLGHLLEIGKRPFNLHHLREFSAYPFSGRPGNEGAPRGDHGQGFGFNTKAQGGRKPKGPEHP
ncbi:MAG: hypothetical protein AMK69_26985 [Nitrospira bacterium SG8_3]|nr:MAG: hypothetical protein AMK69_26985 [Nitrospira bacterium SG8_3]